eukprot:SAG22_NODE_3163_length_1888_cov_1.853549_2_plen_57_part_00
MSTPPPYMASYLVEPAPGPGAVVAVVLGDALKHGDGVGNPTAAEPVTAGPQGKALS